MRSEPPARLAIVGIVAVGLLLRLALYTGFAVGDDVFYQLQAIAHGLGGVWPPEPYHWQTRLAITLPTAALLRLTGLTAWVFTVVPLAASTAGIWVTYRIARDFVSERTALLAAVFYACYPLELIYSTHLFPDLPVALFQSLSLWYWIHALRSERSSDYAWAGLYFGIGYLCRETVVMSGPAYLALWALHRRWRRPRVAWATLAPLAILGCEFLLYWLTTGQPLYRIHAMTAQQQDPLNLRLGQTLSDDSFWVQPIMMLATNQEFGAYQIAVLPALVYAWKRFPVLRPLTVWWVAVFLWNFYGTTLPTRYVPMWREPRYAAALTIPTVVILAQVIAALPVWTRRLAGAGLLASGIFAATLDQRTTVLGPHRRFAASEYAPGAVLEPSEYLGARWASGLTRSVEFGCGTDLGRGTVVVMLAYLPETRCGSSADARYIVFSDGRRADLGAEFEMRGWKEVARFGGPASFGRRAVASVLAWLPGQEGRAGRIAVIPALRVLENPNQGN